MNAEYGEFINDGMEYRINTPKTPAPWSNYLFNDEYYMHLSQTLQGDSRCLKPHKEAHTRGYRFFYVLDRESKVCFNPNYSPLKSVPDRYSCIHGLGHTELSSSAYGLQADIRVFVPLKGPHEIWRIRVQNQGTRSRSLSLFSVFSLQTGNIMGTKTDFDSRSGILTSHTFPHHTFYREAMQLKDRKNTTFVFSDRDIASHDCGQQRFFGGPDITELPAAVAAGQCSGFLSEWESAIGGLEHRFTLEPSGIFETHIVMGCSDGIEEARSLKETLFRGDTLTSEFEKVKRHWEETCGGLLIKTPNKDLDSHINYWIKKQISWQTRTGRNDTMCPVRNELQDAMGYSLFAPGDAHRFFKDALEWQAAGGFMPQWHMSTKGEAPARLALLKHKDAPAWLILCLCNYIDQAGDASLLDSRAGFDNGSGEGTFYDHMVRAAFYAAGDRGSHGLSLIGDGDWTDPINGPGRNGKGESVWTTMALRYALLRLIPFCERKGDAETALKLGKIAAELKRAVEETAWDGDWYIYGYDDEGKAFGTSREEEGKIYLNVQTWAVISGCAEGERKEKCLSAIDRLDTNCGPVLLWPPFSGWNERIGRLSLKLAGTTENGSVYCHGSLFKAFADCVGNRPDKAYETVRKTLPTNPLNPPEKNLQVPIFIPNFYFGLKDSPNFGRSSQNNSTGTVSWLLWVVVEHILGVRATVDGLMIDPGLPAGWNGYTMTRKYRSAKYEIHVRKTGSRADTGVKEIKVNGKPLAGNLLPYKAGETCQVEVLIH
jgi:cellobiose phosphorylase